VDSPFKLGTVLNDHSMTEDKKHSTFKKTIRSRPLKTFQSVISEPICHIRLPLFRVECSSMSPFVIGRPLSGALVATPRQCAAARPRRFDRRDMVVRPGGDSRPSGAFLGRDSLSRPRWTNARAVAAEGSPGHRGGRERIRLQMFRRLSAR
jgi:hypothetical protein